MSFYLTVIYSITALVSILVALLLFNLTKSSARAKIATSQKSKEGNGPDSGVAPQGQGLFDEITEIVDTRPPRDEAVKKIADIFSRELEKKVNLNTQELSRKYEGVINEAKQNEEIAWKKYKKILTLKEKTEAVLHSVAEGLVVVDSQGKVIMMNPAAEKLLGVSKKNKLGKPLLENLREEQLVSLIKGGQDQEEKEIELISQLDETKKTLRASSAVIENESGQTVGMVSVLSDITKQKELDRMKSSFVANVSHELRTPLVAIEKSLFLILEKSAGEVSPTQEEFLTIATKNLKRLSLLINDLLDLSKLEAGKLEFRPQLSSIEKIIDESIEALNNWARTKSVIIKKKITLGVPPVNVDANRIIQVLNNLIGNAIKFTPQGGTICIEVKHANENSKIQVSVEDTGLGIAKESLEKIFDKFFQASERVASDISGTGIGLSISKEIVTLHGGRIWAESEAGQGAKFKFTLPLVKDAQ